MVSIIIPVYNEKENISPLCKEIVGVMAKLRTAYEILFVNDGSTDGTQRELLALYKKYPNAVSVIEFRRNFGKAAAYDAGFRVAKGDMFITLDGDGQDDPRYIGKLLAKLREGYDMVSGWKQNRKDSAVKNISSLLFNRVARTLSSAKLHDYNCGLKAYRSETTKTLPLYGELHRYIPVLLSAQGYKVTEIPVEHRRRMSGKSKYGPVRFINGFLDFLTVVSITRFRARPMHLFGYIGSGFFGIGFLFGLYLTFVKFVMEQPIGNRPLLLFSVMLMIMGVQVGITGLVGEYIVHSTSSERDSYDIKTTVTHEQ